MVGGGGSNSTQLIPIFFSGKAVSKICESHDTGHRSKPSLIRGKKTLMAYLLPTLFWKTASRNLFTTSLQLKPKYEDEFDKIIL